jgi:hypothetical protein
LAQTIQNLEGFEHLQARFARLTDLDAVALMVTWTNIISRDNTEGVLAGLDKDGTPLRPVTYRPYEVTDLTRRQRNNAARNRKRGIFAGIGNFPAGLNNNLTMSEYRRLDGPPLAPRRQFSRVITNLKFEPPQHAGSLWIASARWMDVVSVKGVHFLRFHFDGEGRLPRRDLRGVRPQSIVKAKEAARKWAIAEIRNSGNP